QVVLAWCSHVFHFLLMLTEPAFMLGDSHTPLFLHAVPLQNLAVTANLFNVMHRLPTAGITMFGLGVILAFGEQGQILAHIGPFVGVIAVSFSQHSSIFQMT